MAAAICQHRVAIVIEGILAVELAARAAHVHLAHTPLLPAEARRVIENAPGAFLFNTKPEYSCMLKKFIT
jgi:hypothetical protein